MPPHDAYSTFPPDGITISSFIITQGNLISLLAAPRVPWLPVFTKGASLDIRIELKIRQMS